MAFACAVLVLSPTRAVAQAVYPSAEAAAAALTAAIEGGDPEATKVVLGEDWKKFVPTEGIDDENVQRYLAAWNTSHEIVTEEEGRTMVAVGDRGWTLPIPLVESEAGWRFDVLAGADEMRTRRIGRNELAVIDAALAYVEAQREYALRDRNGDGVLQYARRIVSTPGETDGLYWASLEGEEPSPLGPLFGDDEPGNDYNGYYSRILEGQGANARGGAYGYVLGGRMVGGFALIAWPVAWDDTGVMTFAVSHDGVVYQTDLGPETDELARAVKLFDPGEGWTKVQK